MGLGGSGLAAIAEFLARGLSVTGLEARTVGAGAAGRNGGFLLAGGAPFHHDAVVAWGREAAVAVHAATLDELDRMAREAPDLIRRCGSRRIAMSEAEQADCEAQFDAMTGDGLRVSRYLGPEGVGLQFEDDGAFHPLAHCRRTAGQLAMRGAELHEQTPALSVEAGAVVTASGTVRAEHIVVAVDGLLHRLVPELANEIRPVRLQMLGTSPTPEVAIPCPIYANYGFDYWQQLPDGRVLVGGGRDRGTAEAETDCEETSVVVQEHLEQLLREVIGARDTSITHRWAGIVGYTPDERPVIREAHPGVWAIGGYSGTGNLVGRRIARGVVQQALTGSTTLLEGFVA